MAKFTLTITTPTDREPVTRTDDVAERARIQELLLTIASIVSNTGSYAGNATGAAVGAQNSPTRLRRFQMPAETPVDMGMVSAPPAAGSASPPTQQPSSQQQPSENPNTRGHSPARDHREQALAGAAERKLTVGGIEYPEQSVAEALADRAQRQIVQAGLPKDPNGYEIKLPEGFKPPEGMQFEFKTDDPALKQFREIAHRRGMDQATFSEALGAFASVKVDEPARFRSRHAYRSGCHMADCEGRRQGQCLGRDAQAIPGRRHCRSIGGRHPGLLEPGR